MELLECVPNISEGRRPEVIERLREAASSVAGAALLDVSSDPDHNRSVLTLAGAPAALEAAILRVTAVALETIDLGAHVGVHPRMGAVDVVPLIPLAGLTMADAVECAQGIGKAMAEGFDLPIFLYEEAATSPARRNLAALRRGGPEAVGRRLTEPGGQPDFGPARLHAKGGAAVVGARDFLIAFNVLLESDDLESAKQIARSVRESSGGLPALKAIGVMLASHGRAQVSMNLVDYRITSPLDAVLAVRQEAERLGVGVGGTELVGLIPRAALEGTDPEELMLANFHPGLVLERALEDTGLAAPAPPDGAAKYP